MVVPTGGFPNSRNNHPLANHCSARSMTIESNKWRSHNSRRPTQGSTTSSRPPSQRSTPSAPACMSGSRPLPGRAYFGERMDRMMDQVRRQSSCTPAPPTPSLTDKEKAELVGKCYLCKEPGHMTRNCPQGNKVKSSTGKPPGKSNSTLKRKSKSWKAYC